MPENIATRPMKKNSTAIILGRNGNDFIVVNW